MIDDPASCGWLKFRAVADMLNVLFRGYEGYERTLVASALADKTL